jgi:hypothetical protein
MRTWRLADESAKRTNGILAKVHFEEPLLVRDSRVTSDKIYFLLTFFIKVSILYFGDYCEIDKR